MEISVLYVVYWGALEPLGQSLVVPSVTGLARLGVTVTLVTFDKAADLQRQEELARTRDLLSRDGVRWVSLRYHKRPQLPAKMFDSLQGVAASLASSFTQAPKIVHARTYFGGIMGRVLAPLLGARLVFHNEGFYPDEQVDGGVWRKGSPEHRIARFLENQIYRRADGVIVLSERARNTIQLLPRVQEKKTPVAVVGSTVDLDRFTPPTLKPVGRRPLRFVYSGSVGLRYLFGAVVQFVAIAREELEQASLLVLTRGDRQLAEGVLAESGLPDTAWSLDGIPYSQMPDELRRCDVGLFFLTQGLSEHGCSPTKVGEYWACGLPVVVTPNVSDLDEIIARHRTGVIVREHSPQAYRAAFHELISLLGDVELGARCRKAAETYYALGPGCERQLELYQRVLGL